MYDRSSIKKTGSPSAQSGRRRRTGALLAILFLFVCCASSFYVYMNVMRTVREKRGLTVATQTPDLSSIAEASELQTTSDEFARMGMVTSSAMQTALLAEISAKNPVAQPAALISRATASRARLEKISQVTELAAPEVTVLAIMISEQDKIATVNIRGEDTGLVVRHGTKFSGGEAQITKIDEKGVTFTWRGKSYTVAM
jgi:type II secretory pathway component PulC